MSLVLLALAVLLAPAAAVAQRPKPPAPNDGRWAPIRRVFGQQGKTGDGYFRIELPRTDLHVRIAGDTLSPRFEFTSYAGFVPVGAGGVMSMGEIVLVDSEVPAALAEAHRQGVRVTALHNHLIGETPRIMYLHVMAEGTPDAVARKLRAVYAATATPLAAPDETPASADWSAVDSILGPHADAEGSVAEYEFPRHERLTVHGRAVKSSGEIETASEAVFEQLGDGRVASTGELYLLPAEVDPVVRALDEHGLHVTAVHSHMVDDAPARFWVHWYATGDAPTLARGVAAALAHMNGARKSTSSGA